MRRRNRKARGKRRKGPSEAQSVKRTLGINHRLEPLPPRFRTTLSFQSNSLIRNAASTFANSVFWPTYLFDVDPLVGSTAIPFFTEMAGFYRYYRLVSFTCTATFANLDATTAGTVYLIPLNINPGANALTFQSMLSNNRCKTAIMGLSGGNGISKTLRIRAGVDEFGGVVWSGQTDAYSGTTSGSSAPVNNIYVAAGWSCTPAMGNGVVADVVFKFDVEFFEYTTPPT